MANRSRSFDVYGDTLALTRQLIACPSVTPDDGGALRIVSSRLAAAGFVCERLDRGRVSNLWARQGSDGPLICFAGHVDVVPPGPLDRWTSNPFVAAERDGYLYGRGASDMKMPLAAMVTAAERLAAVPRSGGSIALLLTSDEEGDAVDGTVAVVEALRARGEAIDACILGEPTSSEELGDTIKNGRRGSLNGVLTVKGIQCHIAYPERGRNPIHQALPALTELSATDWDFGNEHFQPTSFQVSNIHGGAGATNVIPGTVEVQFNFRFSPESPEDTLRARVDDLLAGHGLEYELAWNLVGRPFITSGGQLIGALQKAIEAVTGVTPQLSTGGGTSDGRFIATIAREVVEFGPSNESIHKIDERVRLADIAPLSTIYERTLRVMLPGLG